MLNLIAALSNHHVIGHLNQLPWQLPNDLAWFKAQTLNHPIIMGRKTFDSIGRLLPQRENIVITRQAPSYYQPHLHYADSLEKAIAIAKQHDETMFVIGGAQIYQQALPFADRLYLTHVKANLHGDAFFPEYDLKKWHSVFKEAHFADERHLFNYDFEILERR